MKLRTQDVLLFLGFISPILLFISYWAAEGFRLPLSIRYALYVMQDPTLPAIVSISFVVSAYLAINSVEPSERHQEFFDEAARWFFLPIYMTIVFLVLFWFRYDFSSFPAETIFPTLARTLPATLTILIPAVLVLALGILSMANDQRRALAHSIIMVVGALLIFGGAFFQFFLQGTSGSRLGLGYGGAAAVAYALMVVGAGILFYSIRRFAVGQAPSPKQDEKD